MKWALIMLNQQLTLTYEWKAVKQTMIDISKGVKWLTFNVVCMTMYGNLPQQRCGASVKKTTKIG